MVDRGRYEMGREREKKLTLIHSGRFTPQPRQSMLRRIQVLQELSTRISSHFCGTKHGGKRAAVSEEVDLDNHQLWSYLSTEAACPVNIESGKRPLISLCRQCEEKDGRTSIRPFRPSRNARRRDQDARGYSVSFWNLASHGPPAEELE